MDCLNREGEYPAHWSLDSSLGSINSLCCFFDEFSFAWVPRKANVFAHTVCQWAARNCFSGFLSFDDLVVRIPYCLRLGLAFRLTPVVSPFFLDYITFLLDKKKKIIKGL